MSNTLNTAMKLACNNKSYTYFSLKKIEELYDISRLPFSLKILLENLLRNENGIDVTVEDIEALCKWDPKAKPATEIAFTPSRVVLQDFTGVPAVVDLAAMRDAMKALGGDVQKINPLSPAELVIDHSIQVDKYGTADAAVMNTQIEFQRNMERYGFLKWGQTAFDSFSVVPPGNGIVHQVNLEYLARVIFGAEQNGELMAYPDTVVGTDSHTTMINGIGVLGWGVGGIEAEAAMLGQAISMLIPQVVGFKLTGNLQEGVTATDLVLTVVDMLREHGVVGKFVEFFGSGLQHLPLADRATIANMAPEYGATCGIFPVDKESLRYLSLTGRSDEQVNLVEQYAKAQGMFHDENSIEAEYTAVLELDMSTVVPSISGPKRPQDRIVLTESKEKFQSLFKEFENGRAKKSIPVAAERGNYEFTDGDIAVAAITSCTNTSNPAVMLGAGLLARNAAAKGLKVKPWVKTSLAPGSRVVSHYLNGAGVMDDLESLGFNVVGFGCTTCIGNSGPLDPALSSAINDNDLIATSVLSGNRNFEGRIHADIQMNFLASPPLVVAYAIAGTMDFDLQNDSLGDDQNGNPIYLKDIWPSNHEIADTIQKHVSKSSFSEGYEGIFEGDENWEKVKTTQSELFDWQADSTYIKNPPYFEGMTLDVGTIDNISGARVLAKLGDSVTTDHISPAGAIAEDSPAGHYLKANGVEKVNFNSYGSRRGNHEVMMRGTFANIRLRNQLAPGTEGGWTRHQPSDEEMSIFDASMKYQAEGTPLVIIGGTEYGTGSSRDWAAKGTNLLGVKAVIVQSYERIHRSNLVGMGVIPLQFKPGESADTFELTGHEVYDISGLKNGESKVAQVNATRPDGSVVTFEVDVRIDTPKEVEYCRHGGILHYVLRNLAS
ncbi:aconitate hydratase AcnA [Marinicella rhabdoformis]|uniref:aconitate hydratase AcnA n=1 Tax=Marinicella rhabdoformis TaxID=2580566 RepID=UPI0012AEC8C8|nr:aconitate hydratase AcnA [Marinicella rhabdoformis]